MLESTAPGTRAAAGYAESMPDATPPSGPARSTTPVRAEIQALRAIAVLAVVLFHFWPLRFPGGYVGVDIFFAISGYLITSQLLREFDSSGRISLPRFWARRARRLLPASLLVLVATAIFIYAAEPAALWSSLLREVIAASLYVENWALASNSVNYLASTGPASLTQHFWSLSVEEQFYLVWPLLLLAAVYVAVRLFGRSGHRRRSVIFVVFAIVTLASFGVSIVMTRTDSAPAYFVTQTRAWEFGAGGLLALIGVAARGRMVRAIVGWLGVFLIVWAVLRFSGTTPFPSYWAAIPVVGTLAVIWAGVPRTWFAPTRLLDLAPVKFVGDISYSLYLWHWPLLLGAPVVLAAPLGTATKAIVLAVAVLLAWLTKRFVEDPIRSSSSALSRARPAMTYASMLAGMSAVVLVSTVGIAVIQDRAASAADLVGHARSLPSVCLGAAAMDPQKTNCDNAALEGRITPDPTALTEDTGSGFSCDADRKDPIKVCHFGSTSPDAIRVAFTGDSHAAMLLPVLEKQLKALNWSLDTYVGGGCVWGNFENNAICDNRKVLQSTFESSKYQIVIEATTRWALGPLYITGPAQFPAGAPDSRIAGFEAAWKPVVARGGKVIVIGDNPSFPQSAITCLQDSFDVNTAERCTVPASVGLNVSDAAARAAKQTPGVSLVDLTKYYCTKTECPLVIGNVAAYYNTTHITETYAQTLGPYLRKQLAAAAGP
jgi:peptidoglycan/LPS O-acetylase OafA/YrhL